jgi:hypothetical protein
VVCQKIQYDNSYANELTKCEDGTDLLSSALWFFYVFFKSALILSPFLYLYILGVIRYDENGNPEPIADTRVRAMEIFAVRNIMTFIIGFSNNNFCY